MPPSLALSELLGAPVIDSTGSMCGRVREVALYPQEDPARVSAFVVRTKAGDRLLSPDKLASIASNSVRSSKALEDWSPMTSTEGLLLLERDLLDQQIIDVHGRKVVRVNDVDMTVENGAGRPLTLRISEVEVGPRGAVRRLLKGIVPRAAIQAMVNRLSPKAIPWEFVDLIETDPARRVRLKIEQNRLAKLHPADIADILEELAPAEREAVFESLDEEIAAEALEEVDPRLQASLIESLESEHAADIVEEMDPDAAADLLESLPEERSEEILEEMEPEEREEVEELLEHKEDTAAGRMTTEFISAGPSNTAEEAVTLLRNFEGGVETLSTIFVVDYDQKLLGSVPLANIALAPQNATLDTLMTEPLISCKTEASEAEVAELFDKYNLLTLPVVDEEGHLAGVITADDVISLLRKKL
jgi:CBS domain-containing protein